MTHPVIPQSDPRFDLVIDRIIPLSRELIWIALTDPDWVKQWFAPAPWKTVDCEMDVYPGGKFHTVMRSPKGEDFPHTGCFLEVIEDEKLVWTSALGPGYRPCAASTGVPQFTAVITLGLHGSDTRYTAVVMHKDEDSCRVHSEMGFHEGWGAALDQLVAVVKAGSVT